MRRTRGKATYLPRITTNGLLLWKAGDILTTIPDFTVGIEWDAMKQPAIKAWAKTGNNGDNTICNLIAYECTSITPSYGSLVLDYY